MTTMPESATERVYANEGNPALVALLGAGCARILDVGCGAGGNAALIARAHPGCKVSGVTRSANEAAVARTRMERVLVADIEDGFPRELEGEVFDALLFSHVLEHLRDPAAAVIRYMRALKAGGEVLIAVPNFLGWPQRLQFLRGRFKYQATGVLDDTHLRFFTYDSIEGDLLDRIPGLRVEVKSVTGSVPLWILRRHLLPARVSAAIDRWGCRHWPNLFGGQVIVRARKI